MRDELLRLRREIDSLNGELIVAKNRAAPEGVEDLAQGAETTNITIEFESLDVFSLDVRWDSLMRAVLPQTFGGGAPPEAIANAVASLVQREAAETRRSEAEFLSWHRSIVSRSDYGKVLNQMVALGLVEGRVDPTNPVATRWFATPYGIQTGSRLLATMPSPAWNACRATTIPPIAARRSASPKGWKRCARPAPPRAAEQAVPPTMRHKL
jgi:hypothetical protein